MRILYLTPASIAYLAQFILAVGITGYFASQWYTKVRRRQPRDPRSAWLTAFFAAISGFTGAFWLNVSLAPGPNFYGLCPVTVFTALAAVALTQFIYHFPELAPRRKTEARFALGWTLLYALYESGFAVYRFAQLSKGRLVFRPDWADYPLVVAAVWILWALLRQVVQTSEETTSRSWQQKLWRPKGKTARAARAFAAIFLIMLLLTVNEVLFAQLLIAESIRNTLLSVGMTVELFAFAYVYLNNFPEATSFIAKIIGGTLLLSLVSFSILGWFVGPLYLDLYTHTGVFENQKALRFAPNTAGGYDVSHVPAQLAPEPGARLDLVDGASSQVPLPFTFTFFGQPWQQIYVADNGVVSFAHPVGQLEGRLHYGRQPAIFALYTDLVPATNSEAGHVYAKSETDRVIVTWDRLPERNTRGGVYTFQLTLYANGNFDITYEQIPPFDVHTLYQAGHTSYSQWLVGAVPGNPANRPDRIDMAAPLPFQSGANGVVQDPYLALREYLHPLLLPLLYLLLGNSALILIGGALFFYLGLIAPLDGLLKGIRRVNDGDLKEPIPIRSSDEIGFLTQAFNTMVRRLNALVTELETRVAERTQALRESERTLANLIGNLPGMVYRCKNDANWTMEFVSEGCQALTGYPPSALLHNAELSYTALIHPDDQESVQQQVQTALAKRRSFQMSYRIITKDGKEKWVWEQGQGIFDEKEQLLAREGFVTDINPWVRAEQELQARERELRTITDNIPVFISYVDAGLHYRFVNKRYVEAFGLNTDEILGKHIRDVLGEAYYNRVEANIRAALAGQEVSFESTLDMPHLGLRWLSIGYVPGVSANEQERGVYVLAQDITERKQVEAALQEKTAEVDRFFSLALDLLCIADTDGYFHRLNQAWETTLGYSLADLEGKRFLDFVHADDMAATLAAVGKLSTGQTVLNFVNRYRCKDGTYRWIEWRSAPYGKFIYAAARDITERKQAEEAIRRSEEHFRALFETNPFPILITRVADGAIIQANQALLDYMGGTREDLFTVHAPDFYRIPTDRQTLIAEVKAKGSVRNKTVELKTLQNQTRYALVNILPMEFGGEICLLAGLADITEREQAERELRNLSNRFELYLKYIPVPMYMKDADTRAIVLSRQFEQMLGKPLQELLGKTNAELWPLELAITMTQDDMRILNENQASTVEESYAGRHYYSVKFPIKEPGQPPLLGGYTVDVTELKETQAALQESESRMGQITAAMRQVILLHDAQTFEVLFVNPAYAEVWGRTCASLIANPASYIEAIHPEDKDYILGIIRDKTQSAFFNQEHRIVRPDGGVRWVWGRTFPIRNDAGEIYRVLSVSEDITERKLMEEALRQAKEAAEAASRAKSAFLANMSHELRTPLNAVLGFSELMAHAPNLTPEQRANMDIIGRSGEHLLGLINGVLNLSKIETGHTELHPEVFDLHAMLLDLNEMFRLRAEQKGVTVRFDFAPNTPRRIRADVGKLREVLINLLNNAVKFTERGTIIMKVESQESKSQAPTSARLHFEIKDTGIGIAPDELNKVFEAFVQTESGQRSRQGTGLGLPISREYVRLMGGDLTVQSEFGVGAVFVFDIQVEVTGAEPEVNGVLPDQQIVGLEPGQPVYRILIAEDDSASRKLLKLIISPLGLDIREATNGVEAVEIWESWQPHLIFMDMRMPEMDGHQATQEIKSQKSEIQTVIVALTASAFEEERDEFLAAGCDDFVRKPFHETAIFEILARHLGIRYRYATPQDQEKSTGRDANQKKELEQLTAQTAALNPLWTADMEQAILEGDMEWMETLVAQIQNQAPAVAGQLAQLIYNFEHDEILKLIQSNLKSR